MPTNLTPSLLADYFTEKKKHAAYKTTVDQYEMLEAHANGKMPYKLITERRPSESEYIKKYRQEIYQPVTKSTLTKIINSLGKIRRSQDWSIQYINVPKNLTEEELPKEYFEEYLPNYSSLTNWLFNVGLKKYLIDANAVIAIMPFEMGPIPETEYRKPYPYIFDSCDVYEYIDGDFAILKSKEKSSRQKPEQNGSVFFVINTKSILKYEQTDTSGAFVKTNEYIHNLGYLPCFKMPGVFYESIGSNIVNESRISAIVPHLNEAAREYSDLQAEVVQHVHSEKWLYETQDCITCIGKGHVQSKEGGWVTCNQCSGRGKMATSPYSNIIVKAPSVGEQAVPTPPAGYIQKTDVAQMVKIQDERVDAHIYKALAAINFEFLAETPLNQSGIAKEVDRDELNNFVYTIAEDLVALLDKIYKISIDQRYMVRVPNKETRHDMAPRIHVPEKYDLLTSSVLIDDLKKAKDAGVNPVIIKALEIEVAKKKFSTTPEIAELLALTYELDPFGAYSADDKMVVGSSNWAEETNLIISANITSFLHKAIEEDPKFYNKTYTEKMVVMTKYAQEVKLGNIENLLPKE